ncbi:MAG: hypothetical protein J0L76_12255 [Rhodobacterales bacterium]|nr:hypothetical protein [Rhodobacterales bacterium]
MLRSALLVLCLVSPVRAGEWTALDDAGITVALAARVLRYEDGSSQNFFQDGRTLYEAGGGESWGKWWVEGGKYCSSWPPSDVAACYAVEARGLDVRFTGQGGEVSVGRYQDL